MGNSSDDDDDDDLFLDVPTFQPKSKREQNKEERMHNFLDDILKKEDERLTQKELIRDMQKSIQINHAPADSYPSEQVSSDSNIPTASSSCSDKKKADPSLHMKATQKETKQRKGQSKPKIKIEELDAIDQEYRSIMEETGRDYREKRKRKLKDAAEGIGIDSQDINPFDSTVSSKHPRTGSLNDSFDVDDDEDDGYDERRADMATAKVTGYSSKLGVRHILFGPAPSPTQTSQTKRNRNNSRGLQTDSQSCSLEFYSTDENAKDALKRILSKYSKKKDKLTKLIFQAFLAPTQRALKANVLPFFLQNNTLSKLLSKTRKSLEDERILTNDADNDYGRDIFHGVLFDIFQWLWNVSCSSGYPNPISTQLRESAITSLLMLMKQDVSSTEKNLQLQPKCDDTDSKKDEPNTTIPTKNHSSPKGLFSFSFLSLQNFLQGFQLACGYQNIVIQGKNTNEEDKENKDSNQRELSSNRKADVLVVRHFLQIWIAALQNNLIYYEEDQDEVCEDASGLESEIMEVLLFTSLDQCFYSGHGLLELMQSLMSFMLNDIHNKFHFFNDVHKEYEKDSYLSFFSWAQKTAHKIISKCKSLSSGAYKSSDEDDSRGWLALALLVGNIPIFKSDLSVDLLGSLFKMELAELALQLCIMDDVLQYPCREEENENDTDSRQLSHCVFWKTQLKSKLPMIPPFKDISSLKLDMIETSTEECGNSFFYCYDLIWKCIALAQMGINDQVSDEIQRDGPRFHAVVLLAHICMEIGNSILISQNLDKSLQLVRRFSSSELFHGDDNDNEYIQVTQGPQNSNECSKSTPQCNTDNGNKFHQLYLLHLKEMYDRLNVLEENCHKLKKNITMVFTHAHLRRVKEFFVWLAITYRQWKIEAAKIVGIDSSDGDELLIQSTLEGWLQGSGKDDSNQDK